jgi:hypothetical protein
METIQRRRVGNLGPSSVIAVQQHIGMLSKTRPYAEWCKLPKQEAKSLKTLAIDDKAAYNEALSGVLVQTILFYKQHGIIIRDARKPGKKYMPGLAITLFEWRHMLSYPHGVFWQAGILAKNDRDQTIIASGDPWEKLHTWVTENVS